MTRTERASASRLDAILRRHASYARRTMADLRTAGFEFESLEQAYQQWRGANETKDQ